METFPLTSDRQFNWMWQCSFNDALYVNLRLRVLHIKCVCLNQQRQRNWHFKGGHFARATEEVNKAPAVKDKKGKNNLKLIKWSKCRRSAWSVQEFSLQQTKVLCKEVVHLQLSAPGPVKLPSAQQSPCRVWWNYCPTPGIHSNTFRSSPNKRKHYHTIRVTACAGGHRADSLSLPPADSAKLPWLMFRWGL